MAIDSVDLMQVAELESSRTLDDMILGRIIIYVGEEDKSNPIDEDEI